MYQWLQVKKALRGVKVEVTHRGNVRRKYRISGLTSQPTRELMYLDSPSLFFPLAFLCFLIILFWNDYLILFPLKQFPSRWTKEHEISCWVLSRGVWIYHSIFSSTLSSSGKSKEGELFAIGGRLCSIFATFVCSSLFSLANSYESFYRLAR